MRFTMKNFMLATALTVALLGTGSAANAQRGFGGRPIGRPEPVVGRGYERIEGRGYGHGYERGYERGYSRVGLGYGYGVAVETPYVETPYVDAYIPPCPGEGYVWLNHAWVFRGGFGYGRGYDRGYVVERGRGFERERGFEGGRGFERGRR